jgi:hypothetical protein
MPNPRITTENVHIMYTPVPARPDVSYCAIRAKTTLDPTGTISDAAVIQFLMRKDRKGVTHTHRLGSNMSRALREEANA